MKLSLTDIVRTFTSIPAFVMRSQREHTAAQRLNQNLQKAHNLAANYATAMDTAYFEQEPSDITINGEECTAYVVEYDNGMTFAIPISNKTGDVLDIDETVEAKQGKYGGPVEIEGLTIQRLDPSLNFVEYISDSRNQGEAKAGEVKIERANILTTTFSTGKTHKVELEAKTIVAKKGNLQSLRGVEPTQSEKFNSTTVILDWSYNPRSEYRSSSLRAIVNDDVGYWPVGFDREGNVSTIDLHRVYDWPDCPEELRSTIPTVYFNTAYGAHTEGGGATNNRVVEAKAKVSYSQAFKLGIDVRVDFDETHQQILNYGKPSLVAAGRSATQSRRTVVPLRRE